MPTKEQQTYICPSCGQKVFPIEVPVLGRMRWTRRTCPCRIKAEEDAKRDMKQRDKQREMEKLFRMAHLGPKFEKCTFKTWEQVPGTQKALQEAVAFVKDRRWERRGEGLLFFGQPGNGKSHLTAAIVNAVIPMGVAAVFQNVPELLMKFRRTWKSNSAIGEGEIIQALTEAEVIVLDDLGAERLTDTSLELVYDIVNALYNHERSLIVTTNYQVEGEGPDQLSDRIGARTYDRIVEMCKFVEVGGWSYRRARAENRMTQSG